MMVSRVVVVMIELRVVLLLLLLTLVGSYGVQVVQVDAQLIDLMFLLLQRFHLFANCYIEVFEKLKQQTNKN